MLPKIPFLIFFLLPLFPAAFEKSTPTIQNAQINLASVADSNTVIPLHGQVEFYWNQLLVTPSDFADHAAEKKMVPLPGLWNSMKDINDSIKSFGFGTYRFKVVLPPSAKEFHKMALGMPDVYCSYALYVNSELVARNGVVATSKKAYTPYWKPQHASFHWKSDTVEIVLQVANFSHHKGGLREGLLFGSEAIVEKQFNSALAYDYILFGCLLMGGLFFLGLYFFGRNERSMLWFSLFCIAYSYRFFGAKNYPMHHLFENIPWSVTVHLEYLALFVSVFIWCKYTCSLYPSVIPRFVKKSFTIISSLFILSVVILPVNLFTAALTPFFVFVLAYIPIFLWIYYRAAVKRLDGAVFALLSTMAIFFSFSYDILAYLGVYTKNNLLIFCSYLGFFFLQSLVLSYRFSKSYQRALAKAEQASEAKTEFLSTMSHEIRTPLNAVVGISNIITVDPSQEENLKTLRFASQNLMLLINDILDYSKIEVGKIEFEPVRTNLHDLLQNLTMVYMAKAKERNDELILTVDPGIPNALMCDPTRLSQVLSNLLSNAVKFTKNGQIELIAKKISGDDLKVTLNFTVKDNGIGIPEGKQKLVFEAFTQAASSTTRKYGGTGLGLSITRRLLELQGSQIHLQSSEGRGSAFDFDLTFDIPSDTQDNNLPTKISLPEGDLLAGKRILLVEDNPMNILVASEFLKRWKVNVTVAENGLEAIEMFDNHDLVLMDLQMPEMDGYTATLELRKRHIATPIIALTASALIDVRRKIMESGMDDLVVKPFNPVDLYNKLVEYIKP